MKALEEFFLRAYPVVVNKLTFELNPTFTYHNVHHTLDVLNTAESIAVSMNLDKTDIYILKIAALFHDTGYLYLRKGHEEKSSQIFLEYASNSSLEMDIQEKIIGCIMATRMPQEPNTLLEQILCDADLDYLGRDDFDTIEKQLYSELCSAGEMSDRLTWDKIQVTFLENHRFHTDHSIVLRSPKLLENLSTVKNRII
jgi:predicted metal-dependent HD superfamily phosphohydrolase